MVDDKTVVDDKIESQSTQKEEDYVLINGEKRPLKNYIAEQERNIESRVRKDYESRNTQSQQSQSQQQQQQSSGTDWAKQVQSMAEREMEESGSLIPVNTILNLIAQGSNFHIQNFTKTSRTAEKIIKEVKKELKSQYKDFGDYEDELDEILENTDRQLISKDGLKVVFNSLRGKNLDEILKKEREEATKKAVEDKKIIGSTTDSTSSGSTKGTKLTDEQKKEMVDMGFDNEQDYLGRLEKKRQTAKARGAKNVPDTIAEPLKFN